MPRNPIDKGDIRGSGNDNMEHYVGSILGTKTESASPSPRTFLADEERHSVSKLLNKMDEENAKPVKEQELDQSVTISPSVLLSESDIDIPPADNVHVETEVEQAKSADLKRGAVENSSAGNTNSLDNNTLDEHPEPEQLLEEEKPAAQDELAAIDEKLAWQDNGMPGWGQERFECLFFEVEGLTLAMPLVTLGSVHKIEGDLTKLVGRHELMLGLVTINGVNYKAIDTAKLVSSGKERDGGDEYRYVISLEGTQFSLAVDDIKQSMPIYPDEVKWRRSRSSQSCMAGTIKGQMCALLDAGAIKKLLVGSSSR